MDVSLYMRDAPLRLLPLLGGHASKHDWYNLFSDWDMMDSAETFADIMFYSGITICVAAISTGLYLAVSSFLSPPSGVRPIPVGQRPSTILENSLDDIIEEKESKQTRLD